jgi:3-hydroxyisobutyrate dehydrogenase
VIYLQAGCRLANAEMFNMAIKSGMDPRLLQSILKISTGSSRNNEQQNPVPGLSPGTPASKGYKGGFKIEYVKKDMGLAIEAAKRVDAKICIGPRVRESYMEAAEDPRCAGLDSKVVYRWLSGDEEWAEKF